MYPVLLKPVFKEMIWGSESWDISCRPNEMCVIENGPAAGSTFESFIMKDPAAVLGTRLAGAERFPLLVKIINAREQLSVQVHPDDAYTESKGECDSGKSEMWYIIKPPDDGHLIIGLNPDVTREKLAEAYKNGTVENCLNRLRVQAGDMINIPPGLVHAGTPGTVLAEIQQNSDITYRLYDYNRTGPDGKPRQLHVENALAVSDCENRLPKTVLSLENAIKTGANTIIRAIEEEYFSVHKYILNESLKEVSNPEVFSVFTCVEGEVIIESQNARVRLSAKKSVFMPAGIGEYSLRPKDKKAVLLKSFP